MLNLIRSNKIFKSLICFLLVFSLVFSNSYIVFAGTNTASSDNHNGPLQEGDEWRCGGGFAYRFTVIEADPDDVLESNKSILPYSNFWRDKISSSPSVWILGSNKEPTYDSLPDPNFSLSSHDVHYTFYDKSSNSYKHKKIPKFTSAEKVFCKSDNVIRNTLDVYDDLNWVKDLEEGFYSADIGDYLAAPEYDNFYGTAIDKHYLDISNNSKRDKKAALNIANALKVRIWNLSHKNNKKSIKDSNLNDYIGVVEAYALYYYRKGTANVKYQAVSLGQYTSGKDAMKAVSYNKHTLYSKGHVASYNYVMHGKSMVPVFASKAKNSSGSLYSGDTSVEIQGLRQTVLPFNGRLSVNDSNDVLRFQKIAKSSAQTIKDYYNNRASNLETEGIEYSNLKKKGGNFHAVNAAGDGRLNYGANHDPDAKVGVSYWGAMGDIDQVPGGVFSNLTVSYGKAAGTQRSDEDSVVATVSTINYNKDSFSVMKDAKYTIVNSRIEGNPKKLKTKSVGSGNASSRLKEVGVILKFADGVTFNGEVKSIVSSEVVSSDDDSDEEVNTEEASEEDYIENSSGFTDDEYDDGEKQYDTEESVANSDEGDGEESDNSATDVTEDNSDSDSDDSDEGLSNEEGTPATDGEDNSDAPYGTDSEDTDDSGLGVSSADSEATDESVSRDIIKTGTIHEIKRTKTRVGAIGVANYKVTKSKVFATIVQKQLKSTLSKTTNSKSVLQQVATDSIRWMRTNEVSGGNSTVLGYMYEFAAKDTDSGSDAVKVSTTINNLINHAKFKSLQLNVKDNGKTDISNASSDRDKDNHLYAFGMSTNLKNYTPFVNDFSNALEKATNRVEDNTVEQTYIDDEYKKRTSDDELLYDYKFNKKSIYPISGEVLYKRSTINTYKQHFKISLEYDENDNVSVKNVIASDKNNVGKNTSVDKGVKVNIATNCYAYAVVPNFYYDDSIKSKDLKTYLKDNLSGISDISEIKKAVKDITLEYVNDGMIDSYAKISSFDSGNNGYNIASARYIEKTGDTKPTIYVGATTYNKDRKVTTNKNINEGFKVQNPDGSYTDDSITGHTIIEFEIDVPPIPGKLILPAYFLNRYYNNMIQTSTRNVGLEQYYTPASAFSDISTYAYLDGHGAKYHDFCGHSHYDITPWYTQVLYQDISTKGKEISYDNEGEKDKYNGLYLLQDPETSVDGFIRNKTVKKTDEFGNKVGHVLKSTWLELSNPINFSSKTFDYTFNFIRSQSGDKRTLSSLMYKSGTGDYKATGEQMISVSNSIYNKDNLGLVASDHDSNGRRANLIGTGNDGAGDKKGVLRLDYNNVPLSSTVTIGLKASSEDAKINNSGATVDYDMDGPMGKEVIKMDAKHGKTNNKKLAQEQTYTSHTDSDMFSSWTHSCYNKLGSSRVDLNAFNCITAGMGSCQVGNTFEHEVRKTTYKYKTYEIDTGRVTWFTKPGNADKLGYNIGKLYKFNYSTPEIDTEKITTDNQVLAKELYNSPSSFGGSSEDYVNLSGKPLSNGSYQKHIQRNRIGNDTEESYKNNNYLKADASSTHFVNNAVAYRNAVVSEIRLLSDGHVGPHPLEISFYPEVRMLGYALQKTNQDGNESAWSKTQTHTFNVLFTIGELKRKLTPAAMYFMRINTENDSENPVTGTVYSDSMQGANQALVDIKAGSGVHSSGGESYDAGQISSGNKTDYAMPAIPAGSDIDLTVDTDKMQLDFYGYALDIINKDIDGTMNYGSGSMTYEEVVANGANLDSAWGNNDSYNVVKGNFIAWANDMCKVGNFGCDVMLSIPAQEKGFANFNATIGKINMNDMTPEDQISEYVYPIMFKNGKMMTDNEEYKALIKQIAKDYFHDESMLGEAEDLFKASGLYTAILNAIESSSDMANSSGKADANEKQIHGGLEYDVTQQFFDNKVNWYDEVVRTFVIRRFKYEGAKFEGIIANDKLDYGSGVSEEGEFQQEDDNSEAFNLGRWYLTIYFNNSGYVKSNLLGDEAIFYNPKEDNLKNSMNTNSVLLANNYISGADFIIPASSTNDFNH